MHRKKKTELEPLAKDHVLPPEFRNELWRYDVSTHPSYTKLVIPYYVICRERYDKAERDYRKILINELLMHESLQSNALDGMRLHREFAKSILEIDKSKVIRLTPNQQLRLIKILKS